MTTLATIPLFLGNLRGWEWIIILLVVLLLFGGKKIPELMRGLGKGVHSFKQGVEEAKREINKPLENAAGDEKAAGENADKKD
ncbi:MAG: twin-arginine translocase TatA/TatE family subunit [Muribaculaceae bacterium]|nr:twin-arginine translocase TatA/TatE family subunit [Muribaculaceae bacterium]